MTCLCISLDLLSRINDPKKKSFSLSTLLFHFRSNSTSPVRRKLSYLWRVRGLALSLWIPFSSRKLAGSSQCGMSENDDWKVDSRYLCVMDSKSLNGESIMIIACVFLFTKFVVAHGLLWMLLFVYVYLLSIGEAQLIRVISLSNVYIVRIMSSICGIPKQKRTQSK